MRTGSSLRGAACCSARAPFSIASSERPTASFTNEDPGHGARVRARQDRRTLDGRPWFRPPRLPPSGLTFNRGGPMHQPRRDLWTPIAGVLAAVTFVVGLILVSHSPDNSDSDAQVVAWYADHGH